MEFNGKTIFVTGTNRGLGLSLLHQFHFSGANVIAHARNESDSINRLIKSLNENSGSIVYPIYFDLTSIPSSLEIKNMIGNQITAIDVLVINAGIYKEELFQMFNTKLIEELFEVNLFSTIILIQKLIPYLRKSSNASVILISSIASEDLEVGNSIYGITKAGINALTKALYKELAVYNIRVNAIAPGLLDTEMAKKIDSKAYQKALEKTLLHKPISPDDIAKVVLFLASEDSMVINGEIIRCDGGRI